jgi:hypothetical protein
MGQKKAYAFSQASLEIALKQKLPPREGRFARDDLFNIARQAL